MSLNLNIWDVLYESDTDGAVYYCSRKVASGKRVVGAIKSQVNPRDLELVS